MTMKAKTMRHAIQVKLFAVVLLAIFAFAAAANAETIAAKFTLPFEVPCGTTFGFTPIPIKAKSDNGRSALYVMVRGNERRVRSLNLPARGISLIYPPATSAEREMLAKADQVQAVPVITAGK